MGNSKRKSGLTFDQAKGMADRAIQNVKNGIVSAGYALKAIRGEKLWKEQGYESFDDFMERCYQKDKSWASNCIRVYEQFGELAGSEQIPRLQERYQDYSANGLIEMLSMPEELREQVTADMPVRAIRELKQEARKVAMSESEETVGEEQLEGQMNISDFPEYMPEPEGEEERGETEPVCEVWESRGSDVIHVAELVDEESLEDPEDEEPAAGWQQAEELDFNFSSLPDISSRWGSSEEEQEGSQRKGKSERLLKRYEKELEELMEVFQEPYPPIVEKEQILVEALRCLVEKQEEETNKEVEPRQAKQPELPLMKNNDQRKEWLRNYQDWGLWYEDENIGARYYKYDFDNGTRLIAEEYPAFGSRDITSSYLHLVGGPEPPKHPSYGYHKWSRHERYNKHPDSETELLEFLKAVQR